MTVHDVPLSRCCSSSSSSNGCGDLFVVRRRSHWDDGSAGRQRGVLEPSLHLAPSLACSRATGMQRNAYESAAHMGGGQRCACPPGQATVRQRRTPWQVGVKDAAIVVVGYLIRAEDAQLFFREHLQLCTKQSRGKQEVGAGTTLLTGSDVPGKGAEVQSLSRSCKGMHASRTRRQCGHRRVLHMTHRRVLHMTHRRVLHMTHTCASVASSGCSSVPRA
jgi:hypothetical protein